MCTVLYNFSFVMPLHIDMKWHTHASISAAEGEAKKPFLLRELPGLCVVMGSEAGGIVWS